MGTGGATALRSPEICSESSEQISGELKISNCQLQIGRSQRLQQSDFKEHYFQSALTNRRSAISSGSLISTYRLSEDLPPETAAATTSSEFCLRSFDLLCLPSSAGAGDGL